MCSPLSVNTISLVCTVVHRGWIPQFKKQEFILPITHARAKKIAASEVKLKFCVFDSSGALGSDDICAAVRETFFPTSPYFFPSDRLNAARGPGYFENAPRRGLVWTLCNTLRDKQINQAISPKQTPKLPLSFRLTRRINISPTSR